jgi:hypothetical protein
MTWFSGQGRTRSAFALKAHATGELGSQKLSIAYTLPAAINAHLWPKCTIAVRPLATQGIAPGI